MSRPLLIIGAGGHASVLIDTLRQQGRELLGVVSPDMIADRLVVSGIAHYASDEDILDFDKDRIYLVNGLGSLPGDTLRGDLYARYQRLGYQFESVVASTAIVSSYADIGQGVQIMAGAIIQSGVTVGLNGIINTGAIVDHDCIIGENNHIAPGATLSGGVKTGDKVHVGTGACIIQNIVVGASAVVGAGAVITKNIPAGYIAYGNKTEMKPVEV